MWMLPAQCLYSGRRTRCDGGYQGCRQVMYSIPQKWLLPSSIVPAFYVSDPDDLLTVFSVSAEYLKATHNGHHQLQGLGYSTGKKISITETLVCITDIREEGFAGQDLTASGACTNPATRDGHGRLDHALPHAYECVVPAIQAGD